MKHDNDATLQVLLSFLTRKLIFLLFALCLFFVPVIAGAQETELPEIDRADPEVLQHWRDMKFGIFIHWGPVSLTGREIGWSRGDVDRNRKTTRVEKYDQLYKNFNPKQFDADRWARTFKKAGANYVVLTTKHHDGFCLWDSEYTDYDIASSPYEGDIVGELSKACRKHDLAFGPYYSIADWYQPDYPEHHGGRPGYELDREPDMDRYVRYMKHQLKGLQTNYGPFLVYWFDGEWEEPWTHQRGLRLNNYVRSLQPDVLINNRVDKGRKGMKGIFKKGTYAGDFATPEKQIGRFNRETPWESCMTIGTQWAWKPNDQYKSAEQLINILIKTVGGDGNLLLNVGPKPSGRIPRVQVQRLEKIGNWLDRYGEGIYGTRGGPFKPGAWGASTSKDNKIYLFVLNWPGPNHTLSLPDLPQDVTDVRALTSVEPELTDRGKTTRISLNRKPIKEIASVIELTVSGKATKIQPRAVNTYQSLSYEKLASASNVYKDQVSKYGPSKAVDGDPDTRWATDAELSDPWIQIDLQEPTRINRIQVHEAMGIRIKSFTLEYRENGEWKTIYRGNTIGKKYEHNFDPVKTRMVRLNIHEAKKGPTIREILLFGSDR